MDERIKKALKDAQRETREEIQKAVGETTQRTYDEMRVMQENFLIQQSMMQDQFQYLMRHMGTRETPKEERRDPVKGKDVDEGPNVKMPAPTPTRQFPASHSSPYRTYQPPLYHQQPHQSTPRNSSFPQKPPATSTTYQPKPQYPGQFAKPRVAFTPISGTYAQAFAQLKGHGILKPVVGTEVKGPNFPRWYNPDATCEYHGGLKGHSIENCLSLKHRIEELLRKGKIALSQPNVSQDPLPRHDPRKVNVVKKDGPGLGHRGTFQSQKRAREASDGKDGEWEEPPHKISRNGKTLLEEPGEEIVYKLASVTINATEGKWVQ